MTTLRSPPSISRLTEPPSSPQYASVRRKEADIAELVGRAQSLAVDLDRSRAEKRAVEGRMEGERRAWKEGCEAMQSQYQTVQLQYRLALSEERLREMDDRHRLLQMKVANSIRDHRLSRFQARELELTWEIADLTDDTSRAQHDFAQQLEATQDELQSVRHDLSKRLARAEQQRDARAAELEDALRAAGDAETATEHLRVQHSALEDTHRKTALQLQRGALEIESLRAQEKEWKARSHSWESLEKKSDKEMDKLADARKELEGKVREMEKELGERKKKEKAEERGLEKERKKVASLEGKVERLEELLASAQDKASSAQTEAHAAQTALARSQAEVARVQKQLLRLQAQHPASTTNGNVSVGVAGRHKPPSSNTAVALDSSPEPELGLELDAEEEEEEPVAPAKPVRKARKAAPKVPLAESDPSDAEDDKAAHEDDEDKDAEGSEADEPPARTARKQGARKTAGSGKPAAAGHKRSASKMADKPAAPSKAAAAAPAPAAPAAPEAEEDAPQKTKKRKLFGAPAGAAPFQWAAAAGAGMGMGTADGADSIIPSILSPIKAGPAPARAGAGVRALSSLTSGRIF